MKILDCTFRDGGYYTNWDFSKSIVDTYFAAFNHLPVEYLEIGYRSNPMKGYLGEFFYCPLYVMQGIKNYSNKKLVVILNEKDVNATDAENLLLPCKGLIDMVRIAIDPKNFRRALSLAMAIKKMGFEVGFNVMYMSAWSGQKEFLNLLGEVKGIADYFYMVDSYGGVFPEDIRNTYNLVKSKVDVKIGFHGHDNLQLALINTLTAIDCGADIVDATVTGMGRGAGNLRTELLLTVLNAKGALEFDFNELSKVVDGFSKLQEIYCWGTNLPYMVSGANSLPQKEVMDWVSKRFYSFNSIIRSLSNQSKGIRDNLALNTFKPVQKVDEVLIIGGGGGAKLHSNALIAYLKENPETVIIHASSKNAKVFEEVNNKQFHCLAGNEGYRLESIFDLLNVKERIAILPPYPRRMGTYIPKALAQSSFELGNISFTDKYLESITSIVIQTAIDLGATKILFAGYDGYSGDIKQQEMELFQENVYLFTKLKALDIECKAITPTEYGILPQQSIYAIL